MPVFKLADFSITAWEQAILARCPNHNYNLPTTHTHMDDSSSRTRVCWMQVLFPNLLI